MGERRYLSITHRGEAYQWCVWSFPWGDKLAEFNDRNEAFRAALHHAAKHVGYAECRRIIDAWERGTGGLEAPEVKG